MAPHFRIIFTKAFERTLKKLSKKNPEVAEVYESMLRTLESDPLNISRRHQIKKLTDVDAGDGRWRIRSGDYRLRYDVHNQMVVLHSIRRRDKAY